MNVANGDGDGVGSSKSKVVSSPHEVLGEGHLGVEVEMEAYIPASAARGPIYPTAAVPSGVGVCSAVVVVRHVARRLENEYTCFCEFV